MRIIIVDTTIDEELIGGGHTFLPILIKGLISKGHELHLVTKGAPNKKLVEYIIDSGVHVHSNLWSKNSFVEETAPVFAKWVNEMNPDIYLISASSDIGWVTLPYLNSGIATLTIGHTDSETFYLPARHYHSFLTMAVGVSHVVCSHYISDCYLNDFQVAWIPYGVERSETVPVFSDGDGLHLLYVGRLEETQKRISDLAKIAKKLSELNVNYKLKIIGDGPEMPGLKESLKEIIKEKKVEFLGWLEGQNVIEHMRQSEIFILTSAYEGFSIALVEAMANGCCPVVTNIRSGNTQLIKDGSNGCLIEIGDIDEFVVKLKWLLKNPESLLSMRQAAWETGVNFSRERMVENYEEYFVKAIEAAKINRREPDEKYPLMISCQSKYPLWIRKIKKGILGY